MSYRTTVSIPLFAARRWLPIVRANVERLAGHAEIVISDAVGSDASLEALCDELAGTPGVTFLGRRTVEPGWVAHCNDLLMRCTTELHMWLPQDDEIGPEWVLGAERALDAKPSAVLAVGPVERIWVGAAGEETAERFSQKARHLELDPDFSLGDVRDRVDAGLRECMAGSTSKLGLAFRAVILRDSACPLPVQPASGEWADILWALRMLTRGPFVPIEGAVYRKRWYAGNTHGAWRDVRHEPGLRETYLPEALSDLPTEQAEAALRRAWTTEAVALRTELAKVRQSWSWQITRPLRQARARLRAVISR